MRKLLAVLATCVATFVFAPAAPAQEKELNLYAWSEYVPQAVIDKFTEETGIKVNYETYASNEEMVAKLLAGATSYDLIQPSEYTIEALVKADKLQKLDKSKLPNLKNLDPKYTTMGHDPGNQYSVPWMAGTVGIVVNTEKVKDPVKGFKDVFQPKHKGRIVALDDGRELVTWVMYTMGLDPNEVTPENLEKVKPTLAEWMKLIKVYDSDSPKTALLNGEVDLGVVWSGEAALLHQEDPKFKYVLPAEGTHLFVDSLAIPKGAPHAEAAHQFINFILRPEISKLISDDFPYTNPNTEARKLLSDEQKANPASYPKGDPKLEIFHDIGTAAADIDKLVTDLKSASE
jgi:spermidine/putrescine transport system substrate-binding protein